MGCYWFLVKHFLHVQLLTAFIGNKWVKNYNSLFNKIVKVAIPCSTGFGLLAGPWWDSVTESKPSKPQEVTDVKYGRMQRKIPSWLVCGSHGMVLDCTLLGVQVTVGLEFFYIQVIILYIVKVVTPCSTGYGFLADPWQGSMSINNLLL